MKSKPLIIKIFLFILSIIAILFASIAAYYFAVNKNVDLNVDKLKNSAVKYCFYSDDNQLAYTEIKGGNADYIEIDKLNEYTLNAFVAVEDKRFYKHNGIDVKRILGATLNNIKAMKVKEGASTISQQLIKNAYLSSDKTLKRKFNEIKLTLQLEKRYSKRQILEKYLNVIYFGGGAYGINDASKLYFNKTADKLTLNESCVLAAIIKSPAAYSPKLNYEYSFNRKNLVLKMMFEQGYVSTNEYNLAKNEKIILSQNYENNRLTDYFDAVKIEMEQNVKINPYVKSNVDIYTYFDKNIQKNLCETKVESDCDFERQQIVINNKNNGIIAFYGKNYNLKREPASCIKPWYVYAPMINDKIINESTVVLDEQTDFNGYSPKNYGNKYYGNVTVKTAICKSLNVPSVKLLDSYGVKNANNYAAKLGLKIKNDTLSAALGITNCGLKLSELADCYTVFANGGLYKKSSFIKAVKLNGLSIYDNNQNKTEVFSEETSFIINDALSETVKTGTAKKLLSNYQVCAKTGTNGNNDGNFDAYTVCYTKNHTVAVWLGKEDYSIMSNKVTGGSYPAIYAKSCLDYLYSNYSPENFEAPSGVVKAYINEEILLKEQKEYLSDDKNAKPYYYIKGNEPTKKYDNIEEISIINCNINVANGNVVKINFNAKNCSEVIIERVFNNITKTVYKGTSTEFFDENLSDGLYYYTITPLDDNGNALYNKTVKLPVVKINLNGKIYKEEWWND